MCFGDFLTIKGMYCLYFSWYGIYTAANTLLLYTLLYILYILSKYHCDAFQTYTVPNQRYTLFFFGKFHSTSLLNLSYIKDQILLYVCLSRVRLIRERMASSPVGIYLFKIITPTHYLGVASSLNSSFVSSMVTVYPCRQWQGTHRWA